MFKEVFPHEYPVFVGVIAGRIEGTVYFAALNMNGDIRITADGCERSCSVSGVVNLVVNKQHSF